MSAATTSAAAAGQALAAQRAAFRAARNDTRRQLSPKKRERYDAAERALNSYLDDPQSGTTRAAAEAASAKLAKIHAAARPGGGGVNRSKYEAKRAANRRARAGVLARLSEAERARYAEAERALDAVLDGRDGRGVGDEDWPAAKRAQKTIAALSGQRKAAMLAADAAEEEEAVRREVAALAAMTPAERAAYDAAHPDNRCAQCTEAPKTLYQCSGCNAARYCGVACQREHRAEHGPCCMPLDAYRAKLAAAAGAPDAASDKAAAGVGAEPASIGWPYGYGYGGYGYGRYGGWRRRGYGYYSSPYYGYRSGGVVGGILGGIAGGIAGGVAGSGGYYY